MEASLFDLLGSGSLALNELTIGQKPRNRGLKQNFRETLEIKKILFKNIVLNHDIGEFGLNSIYDNLLKSEQ